MKTLKHTARPLLFIIVFALFALSASPLAAESGQGGLLYTISPRPAKLLVYDTATNKRKDSILLGYYPYHMAVSPDGRWLAVSHMARLEKIWIINRETHTVEKKIEIFIGRYRQVGRNYVVFSKDGKKLYAIDSENRYMDVIETKDWKPVKKVRLGINPQKPILTPDGKQLLVPNKNSNEVMIVDTDKDEIVDTIKIDGYPSAVAISADGQTLYVTDVENDRVIIMDFATKKIIKRVSVGTNPRNLILVEGGRYIYALSHMGAYLSVIDTKTNKNIKTIAAPKTPEGMTYDAEGGRLYVQAQVASLVVVNTRELKRLKNFIPGSITTVGNVLFVPHIASNIRTKKKSTPLDWLKLELGNASSSQ